MAYAPDKFYRVSAKALIFNPEGRVMLCREVGDKGWELPGGGIEFGENAAETLTREVNEECGFVVMSVEKQSSFSWSIKRQTDDGEDYWCFFVAHKTEIESTDSFAPSKECEEYKFVDISEMRGMNLHPNIQDLPSLLEING